MMDDNTQRPEQLLTPAEVARLFRVKASTIRLWETTGKLRSIRTMGGHRRFRRRDIEQALAEKGCAS